MRAVVIYESMFGDNRLVAGAIAAGMADIGVNAETIEVGLAPSAIAKDVDLLVVGSPNHGWSMPRPGTRDDAATKSDEPLISRGPGVREWLQHATLPKGLATAAFDTRMSHPAAVVKFDHASTSIEKGLARLGGVRAAPAEHYIVAGVTGPLKPGEADRAREWGRTLGRWLVRPPKGD